MIFSKQILQALLVLIFIGVSFIQAQGQNFDAKEINQRQGESHKEREQPDEIDLLKIKVEHLQSLLEQQQRNLAAMEKRLKEVEEKTRSSSQRQTNRRQAKTQSQQRTQARRYF